MMEWTNGYYVESMDVPERADLDEPSDDGDADNDCFDDGDPRRPWDYDTPANDLENDAVLERYKERRHDEGFGK